MAVIRTFDDEYELTRIKALAAAIGAILTDGAGVDSEDVGMLAFMIWEIVDRMEKRSCGEMPGSGPPLAAGPARAKPEVA